MLQIKKLNLTHKKDLRIILNDFNLVLNDGDKAVIIGEEGNGKSTLMKWIYNPSLVESVPNTQPFFGSYQGLPVDGDRNLEADLQI